LALLNNNVRSAASKFVNKKKSYAFLMRCPRLYITVDLDLNIEERPKFGELGRNFVLIET